MKSILATISFMSVATSATASLPPGMERLVPADYHVIAQARVVADKPGRVFEILALARKGEDKIQARSQGAPPRPLLIVEEKSGQFALMARNDHVVMRADEGGQCDPFLDGDAKIATKGAYFTVENGVACGQH